MGGESVLFKGLFRIPFKTSSKFPKTLKCFFFRVFERRLGSRKFFSQLIANWVLTGLTELAFGMTLHFLNYPSRTLFAGP